jgi:hypothetical protein
LADPLSGSRRYGIIAEWCSGTNEEFSVRSNQTINPMGIRENRFDFICRGK